MEAWGGYIFVEGVLDETLVDQHLPGMTTHGGEACGYT